MQAIRVDVLIPRFYNPDKGTGYRRKIEPEEIIQTLYEIENTFGGYTENDIPITGSWTDPKTGESFKDSHRSVWITCEKNEENIRRLKELKERWKQRFEQEDIMMYYITIDTL